MPFITLTIVALLVSEALKIIVILFQVSKKQTDGTVVSLLIAPMCLYDKLLPSFKEKTNLYPSAWLSFLKTNLKPCKKFDEDIILQLKKVGHSYGSWVFRSKVNVIWDSICFGRCS